MTERTDPSAKIKSLLKPRSIAIVGATPNGDALSSRVVRNLNEHGYTGDVYLVNSKYDTIGGQPCYPSVQEIPASVDVATIAVPAEAVPAVVADCAAAQVKGVVIMAAGFSEDATGPGGERQKELDEALANSSMAVCGPNSEGYFNVTEGIPLSFAASVDVEFLSSKALGPADADVDEADLLASVRGGVAVLTHSGGLGFSVLGRGIAAGIGFSHVISVGNEAGVDILEFAEYLLHEDEVSVVAMYIEGLRKPHLLPRVAKLAREKGKSLVIGKAGNSEAGSRAAISHTGHMAGEARVYDAAFRRYGVIQVSDQEEMLDVCLALSTCPPMLGSNVAVVSWSGGTAVWTADACEREGFQLPTIDAGRREAMAELLPSFAATANPIDITGASKHGLGKIMRIAAEAPYVDALILISTLNSDRAMLRDREELEQLVAETTKPIVVYSYTEPTSQNRRILRELGLPLYESSTRSVNALVALRDKGQRLQERAAQTRDWRGTDSNPSAVNRVILTEWRSNAVLREASFPIAKGRMAQTEAEAVAEAQALGFPVVMKLQAPELPHKAKQGGVLLDLPDAESVAAAYRSLMDVGDRERLNVEGVLVQEMIRSEGVEMIIGVQNTSGFGPVVLLGIGGVDAEQLNDSVMECAPLTRDDATAMIDRLRHSVVLSHSVGGASLYDRNALVDIVVRVSEWAIAHAADVLELDINPLIVTQSGVTIVDSLIVTTSESNMNME